jgi:hypothetical protein
MKYPKHLVVIQDKCLNVGNGFSLSVDLDEGIVTMSFELPYINQGGFDTTTIKKYDRCDFYFGMFDDKEVMENASINDLKQELYGYIDSFTVSEDKEGGLNYNITAKGTLNLLKERSAVISSYNGYLEEIFDWGVTYTDLTAYIPFADTTGLVNNFIINVQTSKLFYEVLQGIKEKYAVQVFQLGDGGIFIQSPTYLQKQFSTLIYEMDSSIFNIDYGELSNNVDSVVVYGTNVVGIAFDPITYQLKYSLAKTPGSADVDLSKLNPLKLYRREFFSEEDCQRLAQEKIVEIAKNYSITINCAYHPSAEIGKAVIIKGSRLISDEQVWIIKKKELSIGKDEGVDMTLVLYSNSVSDFPEDRLIGATGLLDTDMINITDKVESNF